MSLALQHILVLLIAAVAAAILLRQAVATFRGRGSKLGSCCATGCDAGLSPQTKSSERIVFLPVDSLTARSRAK